MKEEYPLREARIVKCRYQWRVDLYDAVLGLWVETARVETKKQAQAIIAHLGK